LNGFVGAMVGGFELAGRLVMGVGAVVKAAVGKRAAKSFVEEQKEQGNLNSFWGETVGVAGAVTLQQAVAFELAQVVAELVEAVGGVGEVEGGEDGAVDLLGGPAADVTAAMQEHFEQADDAGVVDLDPGIADRADGDWQGEALQQRKVDMDIEPLRLEAGKAIVMVWKRWRTASRWSSPFLSRKSARLLETSSLRRKVANFSYCLRKAFLK